MSIATDKLLLVCDRSGGHIFPALTIAEQFPRQQICFFAPSPLLKRYLRLQGYNVLGIPIPMRNIFVESFLRLIEAIVLLVWFRPGQIIGFGGRDSFWLVFLGRFFIRNTKIYEPNVKMGKANAVLRKFVRDVYYGLPAASRQQLPETRREINIGLPVRARLRRIDKTQARKYLGLDISIPVLLCMGGSQGSVFLNALLVRLCDDLPREYQIIHITGKRDYFQISTFYNTIKKRVLVFDFYHQMEWVYSAADVVISRAGASTIGEISFYQLPTVFIPHPAAGRHQENNARFLCDRNAGFMFAQHNFSYDQCKLIVQTLLFDPQQRERIASNLRKLNVAVTAQDFCVSMTQMK